MKNLSKYLTLNLLSVLGYIFFVFILVLLFILFPITRHMDINSSEDWAVNSINLLVFIGPFVYLYPFLEILTALLSLFEFLIYRIKKTEPVLKIPNRFNKIHFICFISGILLSFIPFVIVSYILIKSDS